MFMKAKHFYPFLMIFFYLLPYSLGLTLSFELKLIKKNYTGLKTVPKDLSDEYQIVLNTNTSKDLSDKYQIVLNTNTSKEIISLISDLTLSASTLKSKLNSSTSKLNISSSPLSSTKTSTISVDNKKSRTLPKIVDKPSSKSTVPKQSTVLTSTTKITKKSTTEADYQMQDYDEKNENENQEESATHESEIAPDISNAPEGILTDTIDYQVNKIHSNCCL
jgi:hypothetical protein